MTPAAAVAVTPKFGCARSKSTVVGPWAGANAVASGPRHYLEAPDGPSSSDRPGPSSFVRPLGDVWLLSPGPRWAIPDVPTKALPTPPCSQAMGLIHRPMKRKRPFPLPRFVRDATANHTKYLCFPKESPRVTCCVLQGYVYESLQGGRWHCSKLDTAIYSGGTSLG